MEPRLLVDGLIMYLGLLVLLTFHEFGHAWMAWKCGDDTAYSEGRVSLNPIVHIDPIGTVLMPLLALLPGLGGLLIGWAKPVPVNPYNLRNPRIDDILVTLAGPWMNLLLAVLFIGLARLGIATNWDTMAQVCFQIGRLSLLLCFFNLLPIPPLDGSRVVRNVIGMSYETYARITPIGIMLLIVVMQIRPIMAVLTHLTDTSMSIIGHWFGLAFEG